MGLADFALRHLVPFGGGVPLLGTIINAPQALYHGGAAAYDYMTGDTAGAQDQATSALESTVKAIPYAGTAASVGEFLYNQTEGQKIQEPIYQDPKTGQYQNLTGGYQRDAHGALRDWMFGLPPTEVMPGAQQPAPPTAAHRDGEIGAGIGTAAGAMLGAVAGPLGMAGMGAAGGYLGSKIGEWIGS